MTDFATARIEKYQKSIKGVTAAQYNYLILKSEKFINFEKNINLTMKDSGNY